MPSHGERLVDIFPKNVLHIVATSSSGYRAMRRRLCIVWQVHRTFWK